MGEFDGREIFCPDCGKKLRIEYDTARCNNCEWSACDAELHELIQVQEDKDLIEDIFKDN